MLGVRSRPCYPPLMPTSRSLGPLGLEAQSEAQVGRAQHPTPHRVIFSVGLIWLFPTIRGPILVVPIIRTIIYLGLFWGPLFMEAPI